jgi:hypothetical protein
MPAGTEVLTRIVEPIDVSQAQEGKAWAAVVSRDVRTPEGALVLGAGSPLYLGVVPGAGGLQLIIQSVVARGNSYVSRVAVTASGVPVTGLEPWGTTATSSDIQLSGPRIFVPGQALIALKLGDVLTLR